jgi:hypothetical protein
LGVEIELQPPELRSLLVLLLADDERDVDSDDNIEGAGVTKAVALEGARIHANSVSASISISSNDDERGDDGVVVDVESGTIRESAILATIRNHHQ